MKRTTKEQILIGLKNPMLYLLVILLLTASVISGLSAEVAVMFGNVAGLC